MDEVENTIHYRIGRVESEVKDLKTNHLVSLQKDITALKIEVSGISEGMFWVKKIVIGALLSGVGAFIVGIMNLISG